MTRHDAAPSPESELDQILADMKAISDSLDRTKASEAQDHANLMSNACATENASWSTVMLLRQAAA